MRTLVGLVVAAVVFAGIGLSIFYGVGPLPDPAAPYLALAILAMGWSWAVWVAQMIILKVMLGPSGRVVDDVWLVQRSHGPPKHQP